MTGKNLIQKELGNCFWTGDMKFKNARGKKTSWTKAEAKTHLVSFVIITIGNQKFNYYA